MNEQNKRYPNQSSNTPFQPANYRQAAIEQVNQGLAVLHSNSAPTSEAQQPLVGVIDQGFRAGEHGAEVLHTIAESNPESPAWLGGGVGKGNWANSLNQFVDTAKSLGQKAVANLSFDLTEKRPDGSVTTRSQLTKQEQQALTNAHNNGVLIVASSGNQGGTMSALGQASKQFDNIIAVGAAEGNDRASYSNFGTGLDLVAPGREAGNAFAGTSRSAAEVTGTISKMWAANPTLDYHQVTNVLESTATDLKTPGWDGETGAGLLNSDAAVNLAKAITPDTQQFSGAQLMQQVSGSLDNSNWVSTNGSVASEQLNRGISDIGDWAKDRAADAVNTFDKTANQVIDQAAGFTDQAIDTLRQEAPAIAGTARTMTHRTAEIAKDVVDRIPKGALGTGEMGAALLNSTAVNLAKAITPETQQFSGAELMQQVSGFDPSNWVSTNGSVASERPNWNPISWAKDKAKDAASTVSNTADKVVNKAEDLTQKAADTVKEGTGAVTDSIKSAGTKLENAASDVKNAATSAGSKVKNTASDVKNAATSAGSKVKNAANDVKNAATSAGSKVKNAANDVKNAATSAGSKVKNAASDTADWAKRNKDVISEVGHTALDVGGMIPVVGAVADGVNAGWYAAEGDYTNAALSAAGMVPGVGDAATAAKLAAKGAKYAKNADKVVGAVQKGTNAGERAFEAYGAVQEAQGMVAGASDAYDQFAQGNYLGGAMALGQTGLSAAGVRDGAKAAGGRGGTSNRSIGGNNDLPVTSKGGMQPVTPGRSAPTSREATKPATDVDAMPSSPTRQPVGAGVGAGRQAGGVGGSASAKHDSATPRGSGNGSGNQNSGPPSGTGSPRSSQPTQIGSGSSPARQTGGGGGGHQPPQKPPTGGSPSPSNSSGDKNIPYGYPTRDFASDPKRQLTTKEREDFWRKSAADPKSPLTQDQRDYIGNPPEGETLTPKWYNPVTGRTESMEISHEPATGPNAREKLVMRWPETHAALDPRRHLRKDVAEAYRTQRNAIRDAFSEQVKSWGYTVHPSAQPNPSSRLAIEGPPSRLAIEGPPSRLAIEGPPSRLAIEGPPSRLAIEGPPSRLAIEGPPSRLAIEGPPSRLAIEGPQKPAVEKLPIPPHGFVVNGAGETVAAPIKDYAFASNLTTGQVERVSTTPRILADSPPLDSFENPLPLGTSLPRQIEVPARPYAASSDWDGLLSSAGIPVGSTITPQTLEHIFHGEINPNTGKAVGVHDESAALRDPGTGVIPGTRRPRSPDGTSRANVEVQGVSKRAPSSFFPPDWTETEVVRAIQEAYDNRQSIPGRPPNYREGKSADGMTIGTYLKDDGTQATAFPAPPHAAFAVNRNGEAISISAAKVPWGNW